MELYAGAAVDPVTLLRNVPAVAVFSVAFSVPVVVTAVEGVLLRTVPSPVNVTDVTVPEPPPVVQVGQEMTVPVTTTGAVAV
jgi:hypothetical protein